MSRLKKLKKMKGEFVLTKVISIRTMFIIKKPVSKPDKILGILWNGKTDKPTFPWLLQNDLDSFKDHWNSHRIRKSKYCSVSGVPNVLYLLPHFNGPADCKFPLPPEEKLLSVKETITVDQRSDDCQAYFTYLMDTVHLDAPTDVESAFNIFQRYIKTVQVFYAQNFALKRDSAINTCVIKFEDTSESLRLLVFGYFP